MNTKQSIWFAALLAIMLLLPVAYVASYPLTLQTVEVMWDPDIETPEEGTRLEFHRRVAYYFGGPRTLSGRVGAVLYAPLRYLDEQWRPGYWKSELCREVDTFIANSAESANDHALSARP